MAAVCKRGVLREPYVSRLGRGQRLVHFPQGDGVCCIALDPSLDAAAVRDALADSAKRLRRGLAWVRTKEAEFGVSGTYKDVVKPVATAQRTKRRG